MIGLWKSHAGKYLVVAGIAMLVFFGIPILLVPLDWARVFGWQIPPPGPLVLFFGRSLGLFVCVIALFALRVAANPQAQRFFFDLMLWLFVAMIGLHVYGAIMGVQPITETIEIALWVMLIIATLLFYPKG